jgi:hypothetical protein
VTVRRVVVPAARLARWLDGFTERHGETATQATATQVLLAGADGARAWLDVPFPPMDATDDPCVDLVRHVLRKRLVGVLLVRRRAHAVGIFDGEELIASKVDTTYVQGSTRAGGWSQQRFARRRANQAQAAFADAADDAARVLLPAADALDGLVCGGDRSSVHAVLTDSRLHPLQHKRIEPFLPVPDPRLRVLQATPEQFRAVRISLDP